MNRISKSDLTKLSKQDLIVYILEQVEYIDSKRGYKSGVTKEQLKSYKKPLLIEIACTNNTYFDDTKIEA